MDRIDNDGDGEINGPIVTELMIENEILGNAIDDNKNGLIDENMHMYHLEINPELPLPIGSITMEMEKQTVRRLPKRW